MKTYCSKLVVVLMVSSLLSLIIYASNIIEFKMLFLLIVYFAGAYYAFREIIWRLKKIFKLFLTVEFVSVIFGSVVGAVLSILFFLVSIVFVLGFGWIYGIYNCLVGMMDAYYSDVFFRRNL